MMKCLIVEDEKKAQDVLLSYIGKTPFLDCIGVFENGLEIDQKYIEEADIMFLDIQLPGLNGLSFLGTLSKSPEVIITTAFQDYAVEAFEADVIDYLLKPFSYERFIKAVNKIRNQQSENSETSGQSLFVYADKAFHKINTDHILFLKAEVDYVGIISENGKYLVLDSLGNWENKLKSLGFVRVHRSYLVSISKIDKISGNLINIGQHKIPIGQTYKEDFFRRIR